MMADKVEGTSQQTRQINAIFDQCWHTVYDAGPTLVKHWVDVSCLLSWYSFCEGHTSMHQLCGIILSMLNLYPHKLAEYPPE